MRELIKNVAEVIRDLQTLNLLEKKNVTTTIELDEKTTKYILTVKVTATEDTRDLCLEMFQRLRVFGYLMRLKEHDRRNGILTLCFYER